MKLDGSWPDAFSIGVRQSATVILETGVTNIAATIIIVVIFRPWDWESGVCLLQNAVAKLFFANL